MRVWLEIFSFITWKNESMVDFLSFKKAKRTCSFIRQFRVCRQSIPLWLRELHKMSLAYLLLIFGIWQLFFEFNCSKLRKQILLNIGQRIFFGTYQKEICFLSFEQVKYWVKFNIQTSPYSKIDWWYVKDISFKNGNALVQAQWV